MGPTYQFFDPEVVMKAVRDRWPEGITQAFHKAIDEAIEAGSVSPYEGRVRVVVKLADIQKHMGHMEHWPPDWNKFHKAGNPTGDILRSRGWKVDWKEAKHLHPPGEYTLTSQKKCPFRVLVKFAKAHLTSSQTEALHNALYPVTGWYIRCPEDYSQK